MLLWWTFVQRCIGYFLNMINVFYELNNQRKKSLFIPNLSFCLVACQGVRRVSEILGISASKPCDVFKWTNCDTLRDKFNQNMTEPNVWLSVSIIVYRTLYITSSIKHWYLCTEEDKKMVDILMTVWLCNVWFLLKRRHFCVTFLHNPSLKHRYRYSSEERIPCLITHTCITTSRCSLWILEVVK